MDCYSSDLIRPLRTARNDLLQVLVSRFSLRRRSQGSELRIGFENDTPAIWLREAKHDVKRLIPNFKRKASKYQKQLDRFLLGGEGNAYEFDDPDFFFRYASGGTLPILRIGKREYYCLFYRDVFPIGWNIANGGCDTRNELLNPLDTVERELREELIVFHPKKKKRYIFEGDAGKPLDRPEFAVARRFWQERFPQWDLSKFDELVIPLKWLEGPDCLSVAIGNERSQPITGCFLNINAEDFGIEIDRVAQMSLDEEVILCDGEIIGDRLINRLVGLFRVDKLNREMREGQTEFFPDKFFYDGRRHAGKNLGTVIRDKFLRHLRLIRTLRERKAYAASARRFDLCPVTRRILQRYLSLEAEKPAVQHGPFDVFISFGGEDAYLAERIFKFLERRNLRAFCSKHTISHPDFLRAINDALISATCLIAVGTRPENLKRRFPRYEYETFFQEMLLERKPETAKLLSFISGFKRWELPLPLRRYEVIECDRNDVPSGLRKLARFV